MRLLADENFPGDAVQALRQAGHDVVWIAENAPGSADREVLGRAESEDRILITFDKDFGELAFRARLAASSGIILFRITMQSAAYVASIATAVINSRSDWNGHFSEIEDDRIRMTVLPDSR